MQKIKQVVILAGGKGERLNERLHGLPKPLIDICGRPLLEWQIQLVKAYEFSEVLILVNHKAQAIVDFCHAKNNWGLKIEFLYDGVPRGTAGAVMQCFHKLQDEFLVMYADTMLMVNLERFYHYHKEKGGIAATLFLHANDHPQDSDLVEINEKGFITAFHPYPHLSEADYPALTNAALFWINKNSLLPFKEDSYEVIDFGKQLFPAMLDKKVSLCGYESTEYIKDCGTPKRLDEVLFDINSGKINPFSILQESDHDY